MKGKFKLLIASMIFNSICIVPMTNISYAQSENYQLFDFYDNNNGLSQGTINAIFQDKYGYIWIGTQEGLNRYSGVDFEIFKNDPNDANSISDHYISSIIEDDNNNLWIGTRNGGVNMYDLRTEKFISYKNEKGNSNSLMNNRVVSLANGLDDKIWVATTVGIDLLDPKTGLVKHYSVRTKDNVVNRINCLLAGSDGLLWVGTSEGLFQYSQEKDEFATVDMGEKANPMSSDILSLWLSPKNQLWIGTNGEGLKMRDLNSNQFSSFKHPSSEDVDHVIMSIMGDDLGTIWVGTDGGHVQQFVIEELKFNRVNVTFPRVRTLYADRDGDVWVGLRGGLNRIGKNVSRFGQYQADQQGNLISPSGDIHALGVDSKGYIWSGSSTSGLKRLNRETLEVVTYLNGAQNALSNNHIRHLYIDDEDVIWIGTKNGMNRFDQESTKFKHYLPMEGDANSLTNEIVNYIYEDSKGKLWICTDDGISIFDRDTESFETLQYSFEELNSLSTRVVANVLEDNDGIYWIGFRSGGMDRYDPKSGTFKHYHFEEGKNSLANDRVTHIYDDENGGLWISTYGGGLDYFDKKTEKFINYGLKNGISNTALYCVLKDKNGNLWMSHNKGISKFDIKSERFSNYFQDVEFNGNGYHQTKNGEIIFGSFNIVAFTPEDIKDNEIVPSVYINEFSLFNEKIDQNMPIKILSKGLEETDSLILNHNQNFFTFGFVSLNFNNSNQNQYKYKLENFDQQWIESKGRAYASYTNVPPGKYTFRVWGSNNNQVWNEKGDEIFIEIIAPWWQTWTFRIALALFILSILVVTYKLRMKKIKQQKTHLEEEVRARTTELRQNQQEVKTQNQELKVLNDEKNELIQIVSHDLRSPLNQIKGLASIIKMINPDLNKETNDSIDLINDLVDRQSEMITKVLDTKAIEANRVNFNIVRIDVNNNIQKVVSSFHAIAERKDIEIKTELDVNNPEVDTDQSYFIQVVENLLSNAIKFSEIRTKVIISTEVQEDKLIISVKDEGPGISAEDMKFLFKKYSKLSAKPTANEESTGLGLSITKRYMEVMQGEIKCESELGQGANFIVELPMSVS